MLVVSLLNLVGCAKPADLPDIVVSVASPGAFTRFRSDLGTRFTADQLQPFDTAIQELQLDAMYRDVAPAAARELDMLAVANGKTVHAVMFLGWQARKARFLREIAELTRMLEHDLEQKERTAATGTSASILSRIQSEREVIAKIQRNLDETERRLAALGHAKP